MRVYLLQARAWSRSDLQKVFLKMPLLYYCGLGSGLCQDNVIFEVKSIFGFKISPVVPLCCPVCSCKLSGGILTLVLLCVRLRGCVCPL